MEMIQPYLCELISKNTNCISGIIEKSRVNAKVKLLTDRSIYRPGQEVYFKGILMKEHDEKVTTVEQKNTF